MPLSLINEGDEVPLRVDPEQNEVRALRQVVDWHGKRVLEIGCGDGRLTRRLARLGADVLAIDPDAALGRLARRHLPKRLVSRIRFKVGGATRLEYPQGSFDVVVYSWVL
ncbi:MAG TPA: class I SAM-dependent methyltransferase [Candidatus Polarisedimenticolia bacterium]|nr:class I SAM-dependent methyltransferase [Candidatus Polarisedimenticolia bacterium]